MVHCIPFYPGAGGPVECPGAAVNQYYISRFTLVRSDHEAGRAAAGVGYQSAGAEYGETHVNPSFPPRLQWKCR